MSGCFQLRASEAGQLWAALHIGSREEHRAAQILGLCPGLEVMGSEHPALPEACWCELRACEHIV